MIKKKTSLSKKDPNPSNLIREEKNPDILRPPSHPTREPVCWSLNLPQPPRHYPGTPWLPSLTCLSLLTLHFLPAPSLPLVLHPPAPHLGRPSYQGVSLLSSAPYHISEGLGVVFGGLKLIWNNEDQDWGSLRGPGSCLHHKPEAYQQSPIGLAV